VATEEEIDDFLFIRGKMLDDYPDTLSSRLPEDRQLISDVIDWVGSNGFENDVQALEAYLRMNPDADMLEIFLGTLERFKERECGDS
jgi:hypothetical protein